DHVSVLDAAPAQQRGARECARDLGRPRPSRVRATEAEAMTADSSAARRALVVGATGISGGNLTERLLAEGWEILGLCRRPAGLDDRITPLVADLLDAEAVAGAIRG